MSLIQRLRLAATAATKSNLELLDAFKQSGKYSDEVAVKRLVEKQAEFKRPAWKMPPHVFRSIRSGTYAMVCLFALRGEIDDAFVGLGLAAVHGVAGDMTMKVCVIAWALDTLYESAYKPLAKQAMERAQIKLEDRAESSPNEKILTLSSWVIGAKNLVIEEVRALSQYVAALDKELYARTTPRLFVPANECRSQHAEVLAG